MTAARIIAMSGDLEPPPEPNPPKFATAQFRYGIFVSLIALGFLAYGDTPRLFESAAPTTDVPVMRDPSPAGLPSPQPRCRYGFGACDWAALQSPRPRCHDGVGACDWAGLQPPQPRCHDGGGACDSAGLQSPQPRCHYGVGTCDWARKWPN
jgi:hypothetical protein